eukprot:11195760-Alexandrium_andersonii.AAC.1
MGAGATATLSACCLTTGCGRLPRGSSANSPKPVASAKGAATPGSASDALDRTEMSDETGKHP